MSCELVNKIGTGDCEHDTNYKSNPNLASMVATELVTEILEDALDIVEDIEEAVQQSSTTEKVDGACCLPMKGLGDQLEPDEGLGEEPPIKHRAVEKKSRLTDLVKNSKHMLAKLIQNESVKEVGPEKVLRVVELDSGDQPFKIQKKVVQKQALLEEDPLEDVGLCSSQDKGTQKGEDNGKSRTFPMAGSSGKHISLAARYRTLKFPAELKTKKWNFGTKIVNYIRKHQAKKEGKEKEKQASDGVELKPRNEDV